MACMLTPHSSQRDTGNTQEHPSPKPSGIIIVNPKVLKVSCMRQGAAVGIACLLEAAQPERPLAG